MIDRHQLAEELNALPIGAEASARLRADIERLDLHRHIAPERLANAPRTGSQFE